MIRKVSSSQAARSNATGGRSVPNKAAVKPTEGITADNSKGPDLVAESIESALNELSSMFSQHLTMFNLIVSELRSENASLKEGQTGLQRELKALREREVELVPTRGPEGIERILVKPINVTQH